MSRLIFQVFAGVVFYGYRAFVNRQDMTGVVAALVMLANMAFLSMMYLGGLEGGVQAEGPEIEDSGFYGQTGVLIFLTCIFYTVFSLVFALIFHRRSAQWSTTQIDVDANEYHYHEPTIKVSDKHVDV